SIATIPMTTRRQTLHRLLALSLFYPLVACGEGNHKGSLFMKKEVVMDVVVFNYTDRPIFEVLLDHKIDGGAADYTGGRAIVVGGTVALGPQTLTWRDAGSGETFRVKNSLNLAADQIPPEARYLAIHIYPDKTAELTFAQYLPAPTPRGKKILDEAEKNG